MSSSILHYFSLWIWAFSRSSLEFEATYYFLKFLFVCDFVSVPLLMPLSLFSNCLQWNLKFYSKITFKYLLLWNLFFNLLFAKSILIIWLVYTTVHIIVCMYSDRLWTIWWKWLYISWANHAHFSWQICGLSMDIYFSTVHLHEN